VQTWRQNNTIYFSDSANLPQESMPAHQTTICRNLNNSSNTRVKMLRPQTKLFLLSWNHTGLLTVWSIKYLPAPIKLLSVGHETNHCFLSDTDSTPDRRDKQGSHSGLGSNSSGGTTTSIEPCPGFEPDVFLRGVNRVTTGVNLLGELQPTVLRLTVCDVHIKQIALHSATTVSGLGHVTRGRFLTQRTRVDLNTRNARRPVHVSNSKDLRTTHSFEEPYLLHWRRVLLEKLTGFLS